jgi:hypothetical protein
MAVRINAPSLPYRRAASLLALLEEEGFNLRFLAVFGEESRHVRRLVVRWLALGRADGDSIRAPSASPSTR